MTYNTPTTPTPQPCTHTQLTPPARRTLKQTSTQTYNTYNRPGPTTQGGFLKGTPCVVQPQNQDQKDTNQCDR